MDKILVGLGVWLLADSIISVKLYWKENWLSCHSIRIIRGLIGITLMIMGAIHS